MPRALSTAVLCPFCRCLTGFETSASESVKVFARYRPFNAREKKLGAEQALNMQVKEGTIVIENEDRVNKFAFDNVFLEDSTQDQVFDQCARAQVMDVFRG